MKCPICGLRGVSQWHVLGHAGGVTTGPTKARARKQCQKAARQRWHGKSYKKSNERSIHSSK